MKKAIQKGYRFFADIANYFYYGWKSNLLRLYLKAFFVQFIFDLNKFRHTLFTKRNHIKHLDEEKVQKLQKVVEGLHFLLPTSPHLSYSILIPVYQPQPAFFKKSLESVMSQTAPNIEVLIGFEGDPTPALQQIVQEIKEKFPDKIREFSFDPQEKMQDFIVNQLAKQASGHFLLLMGQEDWIRPDLLFRYEQTLRLVDQTQLTVLYCDENQINSLNYAIPTTETQKRVVQFPYFFNYFSGKGLLVPKSLWETVGGLRFAYKDAEYEDFALRLDLAGAHFNIVPVCLYSRRTAQVEDRETFIKALSDYTKTRQLDWKWIPGYGTKNVRAIPAMHHEHTIQVIIPFKDQKILTLSCVKHVLRQKDVKFKITAVDNRSNDLSIGEELKSLGVEVLRIDEPFNYSRLNNLAVKQTQTAADCDVLLFLNNDVDLEICAMMEMLRWIDQPEIGMIGCRLHYPDGRLQHGGVQLDYHRLPYQMHWDHIEKLRYFEEMQETKRLGVVHAVTAACAMVKRETFLKVGGFDEIWYPIAYSDTHLAVRLNLIGLKCFYTPYAAGIHHESVSRKEGIEDYENSRWLHQFVLKNRHNFQFNFFH